jgi:hypothetical protein
MKRGVGVFAIGTGAGVAAGGEAHKGRGGFAGVAVNCRRNHRQSHLSGRPTFPVGIAAVALRSTSPCQHR